MSDDETAGPEIPDLTDFSQLRAIDLPEEAVTSIEIRDTLAAFEEGTTSKTIRFLTTITAAGYLAIRGVFKLAIQIVELRRELRELRGE